MPDRPTDPNRSAIKVALGTALGAALGIVTAVRTLSGARRGGIPAVTASPEAPERRADSARLDETRREDGAHAPARQVRTASRPDRHPDWQRLPPAHLPRPTYWPVVLAFGIVFLFWGVVTTLAISVIGLALLALGLGGWIGELRHGHG
jgi:hypothetical protein